MVLLQGFLVSSADIPDRTLTGIFGEISRRLSAKFPAEIPEQYFVTLTEQSSMEMVRKFVNTLILLIDCC